MADVRTRIAVTGATGFIGRAISLELLRQGHAVTALGRNHLKGQELAAAGCHFIPLDLIDEPGLRQAFTGATYVIHTAARSTPWGSLSDFWQDNVLGTEHVLAAAHHAGVRRVIYTSSPSVYFAWRDQFNTPETLPFPKSCPTGYIKSKRVAEARVATAVAQGQDIITLRPRAVIGVGDNAIFGRLLQAANKGQLRQIGDGRNITDFTSVETVVQAAIRALHLPEHKRGEIYNITNHDPRPLWPHLRYTLASLGLALPSPPISRPAALAFATAAQCLGHLRDKEPPLTPYSVAVLSYSQTLDVSKAMRDLDLAPPRSIDETTEDIIDHYRRHPLFSSP